jgi:hypothetical protein
MRDSQALPDVGSLSVASWNPPKPHRSSLQVNLKCRVLNGWSKYSYRCIAIGHGPVEELALLLPQA